MHAEAFGARHREDLVRVLGRFRQIQGADIECDEEFAAQARAVERQRGVIGVGAHLFGDGDPGEFACLYL
jgi:hypothetical protein